jgi:hypothetical protein
MRGFRKAVGFDTGLFTGIVIGAFTVALCVVHTGHMSEKAFVPLLVMLMAAMAYAGYAMREAE